MIPLNIYAGNKMVAEAVIFVDMNHWEWEDDVFIHSLNINVHGNASTYDMIPIWSFMEWIEENNFQVKEWRAINHIYENTENTKRLYNIMKKIKEIQKRMKRR